MHRSKKEAPRTRGSTDISRIVVLAIHAWLSASRGEQIIQGKNDYDARFYGDDQGLSLGGLV